MMKKGRIHGHHGSSKPWLHSLDLFSFIPRPTYGFKSYSSLFGVICSVISLSILLLYIAISLKDFIGRPPQLVKYGSVPLSGAMSGGSSFAPPPIAVEISYSIQDQVSGNWTHSTVDYTNTDPYFRYKILSNTVEEHHTFQRTHTLVPGVECSWNSAATTKNVICPDEEVRTALRLEGSYDLPLYRYLEVQVERCSGISCASPEQIDAVIESGDVSVVLYTKEEDFDALMYHQNVKGGYYNSKRGVYENDQRWEFYPLSNREQRTDISMEIRSIKAESPYFGSLQSLSNVDIMTFHSINSTLKGGGRNKIMNFYFKLHNRVSEEQVEYSIRSVLHLVSSWGGMASFITIFTFSILTQWYNKRNFRRMLEKAKNNSRPPESWLFTDIRFLHKEDFDEKGQFQLSMEELHFPSHLMGELRRIALVEHLRKREAANKIANWYRDHIYHQSDKEMENPRSIMKKNLLVTTKSKSDVQASGDNDSSSAIQSVTFGDQQSHASQSSVSFPVGIGEGPIPEFSARRPRDSPSVSTLGGYTIISQTPFNLSSIKEEIAEDSKALVQKAGHNRELKPWTELSKRLAEDAVVTLFGSFEPILDNSRVMKWKLNGDEVTQWLELSEKLIHPVAFEGKVVCVAGQRRSVYGWATYETLEAQYVRKSKILTLRFQTSLFGTGLPDSDGNPQFTY